MIRPGARGIVLAYVLWLMIPLIGGAIAIKHKSKEPPMKDFACTCYENQTHSPLVGNYLRESK